MIKKIILIIFFINTLVFINSTPLEDYINKIDNTYKWTLNNTIEPDDGSYTGYILELTSQTWMSEKQSNNSVWKHWVSICVPTGVKTNKTIIYVDGGENSNWVVPTEIDQTIQLLCLYSGSVAIGLTQIPNKPIVFNNDGIPRIEDDLISYGWKEYLENTTNYEWLPRLPMVKSLVKCMDAVQEFGKTINYNTNQFIISGASKRGWVTWLSVIDTRVVAIVPIIMPILNFIDGSWGHLYQSYGNWSYAMNDYLDAGIMNYLDGQQMKDLASIEDPINYIDKLTIPIYAITASNDQFFIVDSPNFFWNDLTNTPEKHLRIVANSDHSMNGYIVDVVLSIVQFVKLIVSDKPRPNFTWDITYSSDSNTGTILLTLDQSNTISPIQVNLWQAVTVSSERRDFRSEICSDSTSSNCKQNTTWVSSIITSDSSNTNIYSVTLSKPELGWRGFFIEVVYQINENDPQLKFTSEVAIVPNSYPFSTCLENDACGTNGNDNAPSSSDNDSSVNNGSKTILFTELTIILILILNFLN